MLKKAIAVLLCAVLTVAAPVQTLARAEIQTVSVTRECYSSKTYEWNGVSSLEKNKNYVLKESITLSENFTVPAGSRLTVNKDAKLGIASAGSLTVKGTIAVKDGGALSVSGDLNLAKGGKISVTGKMRLNKGADAVINGKLAINKGGVISGNPEKITIGDDGRVTIKGTNSCKTLKSLLSAEKEQKKASDSQSTSSDKTATSKSESSVTVPEHSETTGNLVWVPTNGGKKYHSNSGCSNMKDPMRVSVETAKANGFTACKRCYG